MFSQLGPLFKTQFRHTESNDTRQNIPHEEYDAAQGRDQNEAEKKEAPKWEDEASVSIIALRAFLIDFLKTLPGAENLEFETKQIDKAQSARPKESRRPTNTNNAKAVRAYQTMAKHAVPDEVEEKEASEDTGSIARKKTPDVPDNIESKEYRDIYMLIQDLDVLSDKGVQELFIYKSETFVESLKAAVTLEKSRLRL